MRFSANIGFLWQALPLPERITAAAEAGFDAVECHFPYEYPASEIHDSLTNNNLPMLGLNTALGPDGCFGIASVPGREVAARELIDQAIGYAVRTNAANINVVSGLTAGSASANTVYCQNLSYACSEAAKHSKTIVIEPLNPRAVPNYHFTRVEHALDIIEAVSADNLKIMFDFFHAQIVQGDLETLIRSHARQFGHVQISAVHDRGEPHIGEINYPYLLNVLRDTGYQGYIGAEYKPRGQSVESGLQWMQNFRAAMSH
ncbi:MAG: TIM barrel protein [Pseudomonadota bacterium]